MSFQDRHILVVDDSDDNRYTLTKRLARLGYSKVTTASNGKEALDILAKAAFDLVLLDIMMPEIDGYETLRRIKSDTAIRHVPVIMISAVGELESIVRCIELGAEDYLPKPFNSVLLGARVGACLDRKRAHDQEVEHLAEIERQRRTADRLLHAILPGAVVDELKDQGKVHSRRHNDVVVMFCDVVNFTVYCDSHEPEEVVANLQLLVESFEALTEQFGLEKIKTVGDALMATAGLLVPHNDGVMSAIRCALAASDVARECHAKWKLRTGIHVGPVVAGVVGRSKFSYDLWGDTVNVAARLSDFGEPGIYLTESAWKALGNRCQGSRLASVPVKGKGKMDVYRWD